MQSADSQGALWSALFMHFIAHCDVDRLPTVNAPSNLIRRIYMYAIWCSGARDWQTRATVEIAFFESLGLSALNGKKSAYDRMVEDAVAHLGLPQLKAPAVALGQLIAREKLERLFRDAELIVNRNQKRSAKRRR